MAELARLPCGALEEIIEGRAYAQAYGAYQAQPKATGPMVDRVKVIEAELAAAAMGIDLYGG